MPKKEDYISPKAMYLTEIVGCAACTNGPDPGSNCSEGGVVGGPDCSSGGGAAPCTMGGGPAAD